jgi:hypothetical protein
MPTLPLAERGDPALQQSASDDPWGLSEELQYLLAFIAIHVVEVAFASNPQYASQVVDEFRRQYLDIQEDEARAEFATLLDDRCRRYATALKTCGAGEREDDVLATAFADVCGETDYAFCSVSSDIVLQELIVMRGVVREP